MMGPTSTVKTGSPSAVRSKATQPATPCLPWTEAPSTPTIAALTVMSAARICSACDRSPFHKSAHPWHRANAVSRSVVAVFIAPPRWGCTRSPVAPYHGSYEHRLVSHVVAATGQVAFRQGELASRILRDPRRQPKSATAAATRALGALRVTDLRRRGMSSASLPGAQRLGCAGRSTLPSVVSGARHTLRCYAL